MIEAVFFCSIRNKKNEHKIFYLFLERFLTDRCIKKKFII